MIRWTLTLSVWLTACSAQGVTDVPETDEPHGTETESASGTESDTETETEIPTVDAANCVLPALDEHYPGRLPHSPWGDWVTAPACLQMAHDVIVILGCPSDDDGSPSDCQTQRVVQALAFAEHGYGTRFIPTGAAVANEHIEAHALRDLLLKAGVDPASIYVEPQAEHTDENIYWSTKIMRAQAWQSALVVSEAEHLLYAAACDANCCVDLGRLATFSFPVGASNVKAASYLLTPPNNAVSDAECQHLKFPTKAMCINLDKRRACADNFQLDD